MKITKAMGRACLLEMETGEVTYASNKALNELGFGVANSGLGEGFSGTPYGENPEVQTALAMCAAIAGVKP